MILIPGFIGIGSFSAESLEKQPFVVPSSFDTLLWLDDSPSCAE